MKTYINNIVILTLVAFFAASCDDSVDPETFTGPHFTAFTDPASSINLSETSTDAFVLPVSISEAQSSAVTIDYTVTNVAGTATAGVDYTIAESSIVIPAGEFLGQLTINTIDNATFDGEDGRSFVIELTSNTAGLDLGLAEESSFKKTVTIIDDDCPVETSSTYAGSGMAFGSAIPDWTVTATPVAGTTDQFRVDSGWGPNFVGWATGDPGFNGLFVYTGVITVNPDGTATFTGDDGWATGGTGSYDPCGDIFSFTGGWGFFLSQNQCLERKCKFRTHQFLIIILIDED